MATSPERFRSLHASAALGLAQVGAALLALALFACGTSTGTADNDGGDGSQSGGAASGGAASGGSASGGTAAGGSATGGSASGGSAGSSTGGVEGVGGTTGWPMCDGTSLPGGFAPCRELSDCNNGGFCMWEPPTGGASQCGACMPTITECETSDDCPVDGDLCVQQVQDPCQCMGPSTLCQPPCTETSCGFGEVCYQQTGLCRPANCQEDAFACPAETACDPARVGADVHGCVPASCDGQGYTCNSDSVCEPDHEAADVHGCRSKSCAEGLVCGDNLDCNPDGVGCVTIGCTTDDDCDCGVCMNGSCLNRPYVCVLLPS